MPLSLLTDEQISYVVAEQIRARPPDILVTSVRAWRGGAFLGKDDETLLRAAAEDGLTLVTYDRKSIPPILSAWGVTGEAHAGVVFVDELAILHSDTGGQVLALIAHWERTNDWDWTNMIAFLRPDR